MREPVRPFSNVFEKGPLNTSPLGESNSRPSPYHGTTGEVRDLALCCLTWEDAISCTLRLAYTSTARRHLAPQTAPEMISAQPVRTLISVDRT